MALSKLSTATPDIPEKPHQPLTLTFPKREFGKYRESRSFQATVQQHQWVHYEEVFCHYKEKKLTRALIHIASPKMFSGVVFAEHLLRLCDNLDYGNFKLTSQVARNKGSVFRCQNP